MHNKRLLEAQFVIAGKTKSEVAESMGLNPNTLYRKINDGTFKLLEINQLIEILGIEDPASIFFNLKIEPEEK